MRRYSRWEEGADRATESDRKQNDDLVGRYPVCGALGAARVLRGGPRTQSKSDSIRSKAHDEQKKEMNPGKSPFPTEGGRRKSGWGKRFKEREQGRLAVIFPRRKLGEAARGSDAVWLSVEVLNSLADRSLASAAKILVRCYLKSIARS